MSEKDLVDKTQKVILSCKTQAQLNNAIRYVSLVDKKLARGSWLINYLRNMCVFERNIGFAMCQINKSGDSNE